VRIKTTDDSRVRVKVFISFNSMCGVHCLRRRPETILSFDVPILLGTSVGTWINSRSLSL